MGAAVGDDRAGGGAQVLRFGRFELSLQDRRLCADGQPVRLGARAFDILCLLVNERRRIVTPEELRQAVWGAKPVAENNLRVQLTLLRKALGPGAIEHLAAQGYRFALRVHGDATGDSPAPPELERGTVPPAAPTPGNLPQRLAPMLGRADELAALTTLLAEHARVTLLGSGGVGKTTLAMAAAALQREQHADGVWWVELAALTEAAQVPAAVASVLDIKLGAVAPVDELVHTLAPRQLLLVLDNCEHLADAVMHLADALARGAPGVRLLATTRRSTKCAGETVLRLEPLALPTDTSLAQVQDSPAVAMFAAFAQRADARFLLTEANGAAVADICRQLDGLPLALQLAAARVPLLGVAGLRERLNERLRLLATGSDASRSASLQSTLEWSHSLLSPQEQTVLRRLGVFAGSFSLAAVQTLASDEQLDRWAVLEALDGLIEHSLLMADASAMQAGAPPRYLLHETVRVFAQSKLVASGEEPGLRMRHARYYRALVGGLETSDSELPHDSHLALPMAELVNHRAALDWALEHDFMLAMEIADAGTRFWRRHGQHVEVWRRFSRLLADPRSHERPAQRAGVLLALSAMLLELNELAAMRPHIEEAVGLFRRLGDAVNLGDSLGWFGGLEELRGNLATAEASFREAVQQQRAGGSGSGTSMALNNLSRVLVRSGRLAEARAVLDESLATSQRIRWDWGIARAHEHFGALELAAGDTEAARGHWQQALAGFEALQHSYHVVFNRNNLALALARLGRLTEAHREALAALQAGARQRFDLLVMESLLVLALVRFEQGHPQAAAVLLRVSRRVRERIGVVNGYAVSHELARLETELRETLGEPTWHAACAEGERLGAEQAATRWAAA